MVETLSQLGRFHIKAQGEPEYPQQRTPITLICAKEPIPIGIDFMEEYEEYIALVLTDGRYDKTPKIKWCDEDRFQAEGRDLGKSILCENLESWASKWFDRNEWEVSFNIEADTWPDSAWQRALVYLEYNKPGTAIYCSGKSEGNWPMATVAQITKKTSNCDFVYRCNISTHFTSLFNADVPQSESSEWFMMNQGVVENFGHAEGDHVTKMSQQMAHLMKQNQKLEIEAENLRITTKVLADHNQELLRHVSNLTCSDDVERKDGKRREIKFSTADQEMPDLREDCEEDIAEEAARIKMIIQNVVHPGNKLQLGRENTVSMLPDLRMKLIAAKAGKAQTRVSPQDSMGPDLDDLPEAKKDKLPVVTLQGLEGAVVRGHGATKGITTSSSSSNSSEAEITLEERVKQVPSIARGRARIVRRAVNAETNVKGGHGGEAGRGAGRGKPKGEPQVNQQPLNKILKVDDSVFESLEEDETATKPLIPSHSRQATPVSKGETLTDPYSLKEPKGEPVKPALARNEQVSKVEDMEVSALRASQEEDHDVVSESNLSDVQSVEEFPEVELAKTEKILEKMGSAQGSPGMVELCDDIVMMLNPVTSTPKRSSTRSEGSSSSLSSHPSMPPLMGDGWSTASDSGNASENSEAPPTQAVTASDTVKVNSKNENLLIILMTMINFSCSRTQRLLSSEPQDKLSSDLSQMCMCMILQHSFITYLYYLSRQPSLNHVVTFSGANVLNKFCVRNNLALGK